MRRRFTNIGIPTWPGLFWGMALLGLLLLPADYRAGAETAHAHSLVQTWADAADGAIQHHHVGASHQHVAVNWLDPEVQDPRGVVESAAGTAPDVAEQQDSAPVSNGVHLLIDAVMVVLIAAASRVPLATSVRHLTGRAPRVLLPPPRWTVAAT
ncbi:MAG: hypothetical protein ACRDJC_16290 [Thermomicrobiales bacterium]